IALRPGADTVKGDSNSNWFTGGAGNDAFDGRGQLPGSFDLVGTFGATAAISANLTAGTMTNGMTGISAGTYSLSNIEGIFGGPSNDTLVGDGAANLFIGAAGNDSIDGGGGVDIARFGGPLANFTINPVAGTVTDAVGSEGTDTLLNTEVLDFT